MLFTNIALASFLASYGSSPPDALEIDRHTADVTSAAPKYKITRISRSASQIVARANAIVAAFSSTIQLDQTKLNAWAQASVAAPMKVVWVRPVVDDENIAVGYRAHEDDLILLNTYYQDLMPTSFPLSSTEDVGATAARAVMEDAVQDLISAGFVRTGMPYSSAALSYMREKHFDGTTTHDWVTEYIFTMNFSQNGITFPDVGLRIGVHRKGVISSIRATDATLTNMGNVTTTMSLAQAETALRNNLSAAFPAATYHGQQARQGALIKQSLNLETIDPSGIFNYTLVFAGGRSRQRISRVSLVNGTVAHLFL